MKRDIARLLALVTMGSLLVAACSTTHHSAPVVVTPSGQIVAEAPPAPKTEVPGAPPSSAYTWVPGYWAYHDARWIWLPGHWEVTPTVGSVWVPGHWTQTSHGWEWTPGHWA